MPARKLAPFAAAAALGLVACAAGAGASPAGEAAASKTTMLYDVAPGFVPGALTGRAGTKLVWKADPTNTQRHTVTVDPKLSTKKATYFDSGSIGPGRTYTKTLKAKGTYSLYCKLHGGMFQTVKVR